MEHYSQVTIDATGVFDGYAWSENVGYIHFRNASPAYQVAVNRDPQTITNFNPPTTGVVGGSATLSATGGGSGNPVVFGATTPAICMVGGATVSYGAAGTCTVTANQAGNLLYLPATQVSGNILVGLANVSCGVTWTAQSSGLSSYANLSAIAWSGHQFVAVGLDYNTSASAILTSPDGLTWTPQTSGLTNGQLSGIAWSGSQFVAVGSESSTSVSTDLS